MHTTFPQLLLNHARQRPTAAALREKEYGIWQTTTWSELLQEVEHLACGLHQAGLHRGEHLVVVHRLPPEAVEAHGRRHVLGDRDRREGHDRLSLFVAADIERDGLNNWGRIPSWDCVQISISPFQPQHQGKTIAELAEEKGIDPIDMVCRLLRSGKNVVSPLGPYFPSGRFTAEWDMLAAACADGGAAGELVSYRMVERLARQKVGAESGLRGLLIATLAGTLTPGGPITSFPFVVALYMAGADRGSLVAYLTAWSLLAFHRMVIYEIPIMGARFAWQRVVSSLVLPPIMQGNSYTLSMIGVVSGVP